MYDSKRIKKQDNPITLDYILSKVTEYDIYARYLGQFKVGFIYNSPFRKDKNPSFGIFRSKKTGKLLFKDHGNGECGDVIKFVELYTGITNYNDLLNQIVKDMQITNNTVLHSNKEVEKSTETVIGVVRQDWTDIDKQYWSQFGISLKTLKKFGVSSIKYYLCDGVVKGVYKENNPMYAYKVYDRFKIYRPLADKYTKWRNNLTPYDIQGYEQLPKKELIRVVRNKEGQVFVDATGKMNGRGAYLKRSLEAIEIAKKKKVLSRSLQVEIPDEIFEELKKYCDE